MSQVDISDFVINDYVVTVGTVPTVIFAPNPARVAVLLGTTQGSTVTWGFSQLISATVGFQLPSASALQTIYYRDFPGLQCGPIYACAQIAVQLYVVEILYMPQGV